MKRENAAKRYYKKFAITFTAIFAPLIVISFFVSLPLAIGDPMNFGYLLSLPIAMSLTSLPFIIYYTVNYVHYKNVYFENIQRGTIVDCDTVHRGRMGTLVGFYVKLENDERWPVLTKHCHSSADGYLNTLVEVGYDAKRYEWIILE